MTAPLNLGLVSLHTSPADMPGSGDAGGMNVVELAQAHALAALGHRVELITRRSDPDVDEVIALGDGVTLRHLTAGPPEPIAKSAQEALIGEFSERLAELDRRYDLLHSHHWMSGVAALGVADAWGVPHVQSYHSIAALPGRPLGEGEIAESAGRIAGEALVAAESDLIVTISAYEAKIAVERSGADPHRVVEVPPGVDTDLFRPLRAGDGCLDLDTDHDHGNGYVVFAARLQPLKGPDLAIAAVAQVPLERRPTLIIAGEVSADFAGYAADLRSMIDSLGMADHVVQLGPQSRGELAELLRCASLALVPSHSETFGLIALEAAASGVAVVAAHAGGLGEVVLDRVTGRLLSDRSPQAWGAAIDELLLDPVRLARMGAAGRRRAEGFTWDLAARRLTSLYTSLLSNP